MGDPEYVERTRLQQWVIGVGTVVAAASAIVAFTAGGTPHRATQSPFAPAPVPASPVPASPVSASPSLAHATPATCRTPIP
ncbi:MAG TPA: hypothetical protein VMG38_23065 [Trebonia sp.]|nr:hypothetical protein [Trebonia sp.]